MAIIIDSDKMFDIMSDSLYQEGIVDETLKDLSGIDANQIKKDWENSDKGFLDVAKIADDTSGKAADTIDKLDAAIGKHTIDNRSVIARAKNSTLQFPIYITRTIPYNAAQIICDMMERIYTSFVQATLSQNPIIDEKEANDLVFLKKFHTNLREAAEVFVNEFYEPIDDIDQMMKESVFYKTQLSENVELIFSAIPHVDPIMIQENARLMNEPLTGFTSYFKEADAPKVDISSENRRKIDTINDDQIDEILLRNNDDLLTKEEKICYNQTNAQIRDEVKAMPDKNRNNEDIDKDGVVSKRMDARNSANDKMETARKEFRDYLKVHGQIMDKAAQGMSNDQIQEFLKDELQLSPEQIKDHMSNGKFSSKYPGYDIDKSGNVYRSFTNTKIDKYSPDHSNDRFTQTAVDTPVILKDVEIKKYNSALAYPVQVTFRVRPKNTNLVYDVKYIIQVKSVMHPIMISDLAEDLNELITGNIKTLQKVRYKSGEISFKDYLFNANQLKKDAAKRVNYNKRWISNLKRLGEYRKLHGTAFKNITKVTNGEVPIPNGTLILAQSDVTTLSNQTGIDLSKSSNAIRLAQTLFLMAIVIVDSSEGTMRILFPEQSSSWDVYSLSSIDAELAKTDNSQLMKELNRMVNR